MRPSHEVFANMSDEELRDHLGRCLSNNARRALMRRALRAELRRIASTIASGTTYLGGLMLVCWLTGSELSWGTVVGGLLAAAIAGLASLLIKD